MTIVIDHHDKGFSNARNYAPLGSGANLGPRDLIGHGAGWVETLQGGDLRTAHAGSLGPGLLVPEGGLILSLPPGALIFTAVTLIGAGAPVAAFCNSPDPGDLVEGADARVTLRQTRGSFTWLKLRCYGAPFLLLTGSANEMLISYFTIDTLP